MSLFISIIKILIDPLLGRLTTPTIMLIDNINTSGLTIHISNTQVESIGTEVFVNGSKIGYTFNPSLSSLIVSGLNSETRYNVTIRSIGDNINYNNSLQSEPINISTKPSPLISPNTATTSSNGTYFYLEFNKPIIVIVGEPFYVEVNGIRINITVSLINGLVKITPETPFVVGDIIVLQASISNSKYVVANNEATTTSNFRLSVVNALGGSDLYLGTKQSFILNSKSGGLLWIEDYNTTIYGNPTCFCKAPEGDFFCGTSLGYIINKSQDNRIKISDYQINVLILDDNDAFLAGDVNGEIFISEDDCLTFGDSNSFGWMVNGIIYHITPNALSFTSTGIYDSYSTLKQSGNFTCTIIGDDGFMYVGSSIGHIWKNTNIGNYDTWIDLGLKTKTSLFGIKVLSKLNDGRIGYTDTASGFYYTDDYFYTRNIVNLIYANISPNTWILQYIKDNTVIALSLLNGTIKRSTNNGAAWITLSSTNYNYTNAILYITPELPPATPEKPIAIGATNITTDSFTANWNDAINATGFYLDVATDNSFTNFVSGFENKDVLSTLSHNITGLSIETNYYYRVRSYNNNLVSDNSNIIYLITGNLHGLYAGTSPSALILKSEDNGISFVSEGSAGHGNPTCIVELNNGDIFYGTDNGVYVNHTKNTYGIIAASGVTRITTLFVNKSNGDILLGGNKGRVYKSTNNGVSFSLLYTLTVASTTIVDIFQIGVDIISTTSYGIYVNGILKQSGVVQCSIYTRDGFIYTHTFTNPIGRIYKNVNAYDFSSWVDIHMPFGISVIKRMLFNNGRIIANGFTPVGEITFYTDNRFTSTINIVPTITKITSYAAINNSTIIIGDGVGNIEYSTDNGVNWTPTLNNPQQGQSSIDYLLYKSPYIGIDDMIIGSTFIIK